MSQRIFNLLILLLPFLTKCELTVHLIAHSHDDVGWIKSPYQYYYGYKENLQQANVRNIYTTVFQEIKKDESKRYMICEISFFRMWWMEQNLDTKDTFRSLLGKGQFEFVGGGASMNDEATVYYQDAIDNMSWGHNFILNEFGGQYIPKVGWQLDPFGHTMVQPQLFSEMGFNAWFFARLDYQDKDIRMREKTMEHVQINKRAQNIFTHVMKQHYCSPMGIEWQNKDQQPPVDENNIKKKSDDLVAYFKDFRQTYQQDDLFIPIGCDFTYTNATFAFENWDKLINYINNDKDYNITLKYSTPSTYLSKIHSLNLTYSTKWDDFLPYADGDDGYWTGFFSSRPNEKLRIKQTGLFLQWARNLITNWGIKSFKGEDYRRGVNELSFVQGILQHHDSVTGTEKQAVVYEYQKMINKEVKRVQNYVREIFNENNLKNGIKSQNSVFQNVQLTLPFEIQGWQDNQIILNVYNPGAQVVQTLRVKVPRVELQAYYQDQKLTTDIVCSNYDDLNDCDLYFEAQLEAMQLHTFYLKVDQCQNLVYPILLEEKRYDLAEGISLQFSSDNHIKNLQFDTPKASLNFSYGYEFYYSYEKDGQKSGAYISRTQDPTLNTTLPYALETKSGIDPPLYQQLFVGKLQSVISFSSSTLSSQAVFALSSKSAYFETVSVETKLKGIPKSFDRGIEIVLKVKSQKKDSFLSKKQKIGQFFTDSMGLDMVERLRNHRPSWELKVEQEVPGNYYPVLSIIGVQDGVWVNNDRSQGGASLVDGEVELMIHRRTKMDDDRGVGEPLDEQENGKPIEVNTMHWISNKGLKKARDLQYLNDHAPSIMVSNGKITDYKYKEKLYPFVLPVQNNLKVTFQKQEQQGEYLVRYHNMNDDQNIQIDLSKFHVTPMQLTGVLTLNAIEQSRLYWNDKPIQRKTFELQPMEIKTFILKFEDEQKCLIM